MPRQPRIAIGASVLRSLRTWAARDGLDPCDLATQILSDALPPEIKALASQKPGTSEAQEPTTPEPPAPTVSVTTIPKEEKKPSPSRPWHGGPPPYEERHPEIAARVLAMWAGGSKKGGMSREAVAKALQADGIPMTSGTVSKITIRARQKNK